MDPIDNFMELFETNVRNKLLDNYRGITNLLHRNCFNGYFDVITTSNIESTIERVLSRDNGLIKFLKSELFVCNSNNFNALSNVFEILVFLMNRNDFKDFVGKFKQDILDCCREAIGKSNLQKRVKMCAHETLKKLVATYHDLYINETIEKLLQQLSRCSLSSKHAKDADIIVAALCSIAWKYKSQKFPTEKHKKQFKEKIMNYLESESNKCVQSGESSAKQSQKPNFDNINLHLGCLLDLFDSDKSEDVLQVSSSLDINELDKLYKCFKKFVPYIAYTMATKPEAKNRSNEIRKKIIALLKCYMKPLKNLIIPDLKFWEKQFETLLINVKDLQRDAEEGLKALYDVVPEYLKCNANMFETYKELRSTCENAFDCCKSSRLDLMIYKYGKLAEPCKIYETDQQVNNLFEKISQRIKALYIQEDESFYNLKFIPDFQQILSDILRYIDCPSFTHLSTLINLSVLIIKNFAELKHDMQSKTIKSLKQTITNINELDPSLCDKYLSETIYQGILWTCSHTLEIDKEIQQHIYEDQVLITYKSYKKLWEELIYDNDNSETYDYCIKRLHLKVFKEIILQYKRFLSKLNLETKTEQIEFIDDSMSRVPVNENDFRIFINLSEFYVEIIDKCHETVLEEWIYEILYEAIKGSYNDPTISAYFKVINAVFKKVSIEYWKSSEDNGKEKVFDLVPQYISHMLNVVSKLLKEPQIVCLSMILNTPFTKAFIKEIPNFVERTIPVFQIALTIGLGDLDVAYYALNTLERWTDNPQDQSLDKLFKQILPNLEAYLHSTESFIDISPDLHRTRRKHVKHVTVINNEISLQDFQCRVLRLFGIFNSDIMKDYIYHKSMETDASWQHAHKFIYELPAPDWTIDINLINLLQRTIELALNSGDRKTKIAACEVLHCIVLLILAHKKHNDYLDKSVCTAILKLGCDTDNVTLQIFRPFSFELIHYLSSKNQYTQEAANFMLEAIFDGFADQQSTSDFKEFCGVCLRSFIQANSNEVLDKDLQNSIIGSEMLVEKLYHFALHPDDSKRIAAAVIFNHLFHDAKHVDDEFNKYLIKLLFCFIKSLEHCNDWRIVQATKHLEDIFENKSILFNEEIDVDEKLPEFTGKTLKDVVIWILKQCSSVNKVHRNRCKEMFEKLAPLVNECETVKDFMQMFLEQEGVQELHKICLKNLQHEIVLDQVDYIDLLKLSILNLVTSSLDCYIWILDKQFVPSNILFEGTNIFPIIRRCSEQIYNYANNQQFEEFHIETKLLNWSICETVLNIVSFLKACLSQTVSSPFMSFQLFELIEKPFALIGTVVMLPSLLKFNTENIMYIENLRPHLSNLFNAIINQENNKFLMLLLEALNNTNMLEKCLKLESEAGQNIIRFQNEILRGCLLLHNSGLLSQFKQGQEVLQEAMKKIHECFTALKEERTNYDGKIYYSPVIFDFETLSFYTHYLQIGLKISNRTTIKAVLKMTLDSHIIDSNSRKTHGDYFFSIFRASIINGLLENICDTIAVLDQLIYESYDVNKIFILAADLALFANQNKQLPIAVKREVAHHFLLKCNRFLPLITEQRKNSFIDIYKNVVKLLENPFDINTKVEYQCLREWIINQFPKLRIEMVQNFLPCLTDSSLDNFNVSLMQNLLSEGPETASDLNAITYFESLSKMLPVTKSLVVLKTMIKFSAGKCKKLFSNISAKHLAEYARNISDENLIESLMIAFNLFNTLDSQSCRLDIFNYYLWLLLNYANKKPIETFYRKNIADIYKIIAQELDERCEDKDKDQEQLVISKMGCYKLFGHMLYCIKQDNNTNMLNEVAILAGLNTGNELLENCINYMEALRSLAITNVDQELVRLLHCEAYNCYLVIAIVTKNKGYMKAGLFAKQNTYLWENIVSKNKSKIAQHLPELLKIRKEFINLRRKKQENDLKNQTFSFVHFYDINTSTLQENVNSFDFNEIQSTSNTNNEQAEDSNIVEYLYIDYNDHECMQTLCQFLDIMVDDNLIEVDQLKTPLYIMCILKSMDKTKVDNVILFLMRVILNSPKHFKPYMKDAMWFLIRSINKYLANNKLNYMIAHMLKMIIESVELSDLSPKDANQEKCAQVLINKIIQETIADDSDKMEFILDLDILKMLVMAWQNIITLHDLTDLISNIYEKLSDDCNDKEKKRVISMMTVTAVFLSFNETRRKLLEQFESRKLNLKQIIYDILIKWNFGKPTLKTLACEALGLILEKTEFDEFNLIPILRQNSNSTISCIQSLCKSNPALGIIYKDKAFQILEITDESKQRCIDILLLLADTLTEEDMIKDLHHIKFSSLMKTLSNCAKVGLDLINVLAKKFSPTNLIPLAEIAQHFTENIDSRLRKIVYTIFQEIMKRFFLDITENKECQSLVQMSTSVLIRGLDDSSEELSQIVTDFWTEEDILASNYKLRFMQLLDMYRPQEEKQYLLFLCTAMLGLAKRSKKYNDYITQESLKVDSNYIEYKIMQDWRTKNLINRTPLYVRSSASLQSQIYKHSHYKTLRTALTNESYHYTTLTSGKLTLDMPRDNKNHPNESSNRGSIAYEGIVTPSTSRHSNNLTKSFYTKDQRKAFFRNLELQKNVQRNRWLEEESTRSKNCVNIYRTYHIGLEDFPYPNVKITNKDILISLLRLIKKDGLVCKHVFVSFLLGLLRQNENTLSKSKKTNLEQTIAEKFDMILLNRQNTNPIINAVLEIFYYSNLQYKTDTVAKITKLNGITEVGILLLEKKLLNDETDYEPPEKRIRTSDPVDSQWTTVKLWTQLAGLYNSLKNDDVVLSIFGNYVSKHRSQTGSDLKEASLKQIANEWKSAAAAYKRVLEKEEGAIHEHCLQGMYECYSQLSNWSKIDESIKHEVNLDTIWDKDTNQEWLVPWVFQTKLHMWLESDDNSFINKLRSWQTNKDIDSRIKRHHGEEMVMFFLSNKDDSTHAKHYLDMNLAEVREQWLQINTLSAQLRIEKLRKLHAIAEIKAFTDVYHNKEHLDNEEQVLNLIQRWSRIVPSANDDYCYWDTHVSYRLHFSSLLLEEKKEYSKVLTATNIDTLRQFLHMAIDRKNKDIVKKHFKCLEQYYESIGEKSMLDEIHYNYDIAAYKALSAELDNTKKAKYYVEAWDYLNLNLKNIAKETFKNKSRQLLANVALSISDDIEKDGSLLRELPMLHQGSLSPTKVKKTRDYLVKTAVDELDRCTQDESNKQHGKSQMTLARFCYKKIDNNCIQTVRQFAKSTLKAISFDVDEATRYFPCLLKEEYFTDLEYRQIFLTECSAIETWRFLTWQAQIMSFLDKSIADDLIPILERMIDEYSNAVLYNFNLTVNLKPELLKKPKLASINENINLRHTDFWKFQEALKFVVKPNIMLIQKIDRVLKQLQMGEADINKLKGEFELKGMEKADVKNTNNCHFSTLSINRRRIVSALNENPQMAMKKLNEIKRELRDKEEATRVRNDTSLFYYSPWLYKYSGGDIEVPGQYKSNKKPMAKYHAKIVRMDPNVTVMKSLCKPIKITMLGNDGKSYSFLAKSGDDLRLDERIQQALSFMNDTLQTDVLCKQRHTTILTYAVIPFDTTFGLIEWVNNTRTLSEFIDKDKLNHLAENYRNWIRIEAGPKEDRIPKIYTAALNKSSTQVIAKMKELTSNSNCDSLRKKFLKLSRSLEAFMTMRHTFTITYATICITHWILGIGDRHLNNTLIEIKSGRCIGIDFGLAFGAGVDIAVPELMPFRLTSQILGLLKPFSENDLLALTMTNVLKALRTDKASLIACLDIFINESLDWKNYIAKKSTNQNEINLTVEWYPKTKIDIVERKLNGEKPWNITICELQINHARPSEMDCYNRYRAIVTGTDCNAQRSKQIKDNLTAEEQVSCLLDQATDLNILGRTWEGWEPWL